MTLYQPEIKDLTAPGPADYEVTLVSLNQWQLALRRFRKHRMAMFGSGLFALIVLIAVVGPFIWPYNSFVIPKPVAGCGSGCGPSLAHPFGTTAGLQEDLLTLVVNGARYSLLIGIGASAIVAVIGTIVGGVAGYFGGWLDGILMRICDVLLSLPLLFVILVFSAFLSNGKGGDWYTVLLVFGFLGWAGLARLVRSVFLSLRGETYVEAARAVGVPSRRIIFRHVLPNSISPIIVATTLGIAAFITTEAFVSFLGFGVNPAVTPTWGNILTDAQSALTQGNWWWAFFPGLFIVLTVLAINFIGDGLRDALDPRGRL